MITATNNENNDQTSATESGFSVSGTKMNKGRKMKKHLTLFGVNQMMIKKLKSNLKGNEKLLADCLIYLSKLPIDEGFEYFDETGYFNQDIMAEIPQTVYYPRYLKEIFDRHRLEQIEETLNSAEMGTVSGEGQRYKAKRITYQVGGEYYTISGDLFNKIHDRLKHLRTKVIAKMAFDSFGFQVDLQIGEKEYLKRVLKESDRISKDGRKELKAKLDRIRSLRIMVPEFNLRNQTSIMPDVKQNLIKGRLYSMITEMPREYRKTMWYMNPLTQKIENVVEVDIKASHTNFLHTVLKDVLAEGLYGYNKTAGTNNVVAVEAELVNYYNLLMTFHDSKSDLYTRIAKDTKVTRDEIKGQWQLYINDRNEKYKQGWQDNKVWQWFKSILPEIDNLITFCHLIEKKNTTQDDWRVGNGYTHSLPLQLHKVEYNRIMRLVASEYMKTDFGIMTVHDSFLVPESNVEKLEKIIRKYTVAKKTGIMETIQTKKETLLDTYLKRSNHTWNTHSPLLRKVYSSIFHNSFILKTYKTPYYNFYKDSLNIYSYVKHDTNSAQNDDTSEASTSGASDVQGKMTKRKMSTISEYRAGSYRVKVNGIMYRSDKVNDETKECFRVRLMKDLGLSEGDIK